VFRFLPLILAPALLSAQSAPWPSEFKIRPVKVVTSTDEESGNQVVLTNHFRIESESEISRPDFERFATVVESVPQLIEKFPLQLWAPPAKKQIGILICEDEASYLEAGGQEATIGWYDGRRRHILIRADFFLRPPPTRPTRLAPRPNQDILVHELVHMSMHGILIHTPPWFYEGFAEYISACHKNNGRYTFHDVGTSIRDRIRKLIGTTEDGTISLLPVEKILALDHQAWVDTAHEEINGNAYLPYGTALLLVHYHLNGGQARRKMSAAHLKKIHGLRFSDKTLPFLTDKATEIEARLVKFWGPRGLTLVFEEKGKEKESENENEKAKADGG